MLVAHGYDAFVSPAARTGLSFAATRFVAKLALPLFVGLAGVGVALRLARADETARGGEGGANSRRELARRGLEIILIGYALSLAMAAMDGYLGRPAIWLRADALHVIGLSVLLLGCTLPAIGARHRPWVALGLSAILALASPWLHPTARTAQTWLDHPPLGQAMALIVDVPPLTKMPLLPLGAWAALGVAIAGPIQRAPAQFAFAAALLAPLAFYGMEAWVATSGVALTRSHPAVLANVVELFARAMVVLGLSLVWSRWSVSRGRSSSIERGLAWLGRRSLAFYVVHLPFVYGAPGKPLRELRLGMGGATCAVLLVGVGSVGILMMRDALAHAHRQRRVAKGSAG